MFCPFLRGCFCPFSLRITPRHFSFFPNCLVPLIFPFWVLPNQSTERVLALPQKFLTVHLAGEYPLHASLFFPPITLPLSPSVGVLFLSFSVLIAVIPFSFFFLFYSPVPSECIFGFCDTEILTVFVRASSPRFPFPFSNKRDSRFWFVFKIGLLVLLPPILLNPRFSLHPRPDFFR